jgi:hypothetical protein
VAKFAVALIVMQTREIMLRVATNPYSLTLSGIGLPIGRTLLIYYILTKGVAQAPGLCGRLYTGKARGLCEPASGNQYWSVLSG